MSEKTVNGRSKERTRTLVGVSAGLPGDTVKALRRCVLSPEDFNAAVEDMGDYLQVEIPSRELNEAFLASLPERLTHMDAAAATFRVKQ